MTIILIGKNGLLGQDILTELQNSKLPFKAYSKQDCDITSLKEIQEKLSNNLNIKTIINCAAYTKVDLAEKNKKEATLINEIGTKNLAKYAKSIQATLIHFSTDYVFNGTKKTPYKETDITDPINTYGKTKCNAEKHLSTYLPNNHYCFRIQWLFGKNKENFITSITKKAIQKTPLNIINDQWGSPTWTKDIATTILSIIKKPIPYGCYHLRNEGITNWYNYAKYICKIQNLSTSIKAIKTENYKTPAKRPLNSKLNNKKLKKQSYILPDWKTAVKLFIENEKNSDCI